MFQCIMSSRVDQGIFGMENWKVYQFKVLLLRVIGPELGQPSSV